jgi:hypothetical protein
MDPDIEAPIARFLEASAAIVVSGEQGDPVTHLPQMPGGVHHEPLGPAESQIGMNEGDVE